MEYNPDYFLKADIANPNREGSRLYPEIQLARAAFVRRFIEPQFTLADISCGSGYISDCVQSKKYIGVDHPDMISKIGDLHLTLNGRKIFLPFDLNLSENDLDIGEEVDAMISLGTLEYLNDPERLLYNVHRNLKQSGVFIISTSVKQNNGEPKGKYTVSEYSIDEVRSLLDTNGFEVKGSYASGIPFGLLMAILAKKSLGVRRSNGQAERGKISRAVDHLDLVRELYCKIFPYSILGIDIGETGDTMILVSHKK